MLLGISTIVLILATRERITHTPKNIAERIDDRFRSGIGKTKISINLSSVNE